MLLTAVRSAALLAISLLLLAVSIATPRAAETPSLYTIAMLVSSKGEESEELKAIRVLADLRVAEINAAGGIKGRPLRLVYYDDQQEAVNTLTNVRKATEDPSLIGMVGIWSSTRGAAAAEAVGESGVPLISEVSVSEVYATYGNYFSMVRSTTDEIQILRQFLRDHGSRIAFFGLEGDLYSDTFRNAFAAPSSGHEFVFARSVKGSDDLANLDLSAEFAQLRDKNVQFILLAIGGPKGGGVLKRLAALGIKIPVFVLLGTIKGHLKVEGAEAYDGIIYEFPKGGIPNVSNERIEQLLHRLGRDGARLVFSDFALGYGAKYADMVAMIAELAQASVADAAQANAEQNIAQLRSDVVARLAGYAPGKKRFEGWFQDWFFNQTRSVAEPTLIAWRPPGRETATLAPRQYTRWRDRFDTLPVVYMTVDVVKVLSIDTDKSTFDAEFNLSTRSDPPLPDKSFEYTNALRSSSDNSPLVSVRRMEPPKGAGVSVDSRLDRIVGTFRFDRTIADYPFDTQRITISFEPVKTTRPFLVQPPDQAARDNRFDVEGWEVVTNDVGASQDHITMIGSAVDEQVLIPFYKFNYSWLVKRKSTDFMWRVLVPLVFILVLTYFAIYIGDGVFEARIGAQVTALLSALALYLSISKPLADEATLSDKIFVSSHIAITLMVGLSILEAQPWVKRMGRTWVFVRTLQVAVFPLIVAAVVVFVMHRAGLLAWIRSGLV